MSIPLTRFSHRTVRRAPSARRSSPVSEVSTSVVVPRSYGWHVIESDLGFDNSPSSLLRKRRMPIVICSSRTRSPVPRPHNLASVFQTRPGVLSGSPTNPGTDEWAGYRREGDGAVQGSNQPVMVHNPSSDATGCFVGDGESNTSNERLTAEIQPQAHSSLDGSDSHSPPIIYMVLSCRECSSAPKPHRPNERQHIGPTRRNISPPHHLKTGYSLYPTNWFKPFSGHPRSEKPIGFPHHSWKITSTIERANPQGRSPKL